MNEEGELIIPDPSSIFCGSLVCTNESSIRS